MRINNLIKIFIVSVLLSYTAGVKAQTNYLNDPVNGIYNGAIFTSIQDTALQFIGAHQDGSLVGIKLYKGSAMPHYIVVLDKDKSHPNIIEISKNGFPLRAMIDSVLFFYENYTDSTFDVAAAKNGKEYEIFKNVPAKDEIEKIKTLSTKILGIDYINGYGKGPCTGLYLRKDEVNWSDIVKFGGLALSVSSCLEKIPTFALLGAFTMAQTFSACGYALVEIMGETVFEGNENWAKGVAMLKVVDVGLNQVSVSDLLYAVIKRFVSVMDNLKNQRILDDLYGNAYPTVNSSSGNIEVTELNNIFEIANAGKTVCADYENEIKNNTKLLTKDNYNDINALNEKIIKQQDSIRTVTVEKINEILEDNEMQYSFEKTDNVPVEFYLALYDGTLTRIPPYQILNVSLYASSWTGGKSPKFMFRIEFSHQPLQVDYVNKFGETKNVVMYLKYFSCKPLSADGSELAKNGFTISKDIRVKREISTGFSLEIAEKIEKFEFCKSDFGGVY
jgi:hypothetical protein